MTAKDATKIAHCPECETTVTKDSTEAAIETVESHNERRHDGEQVAGLGRNAFSVPQFSDEEKATIQENVRKFKEALE